MSTENFWDLHRLQNHEITMNFVQATPFFNTRCGARDWKRKRRLWMGGVYSLADFNNQRGKFGQHDSTTWNGWFFSEDLFPIFIARCWSSGKMLNSGNEHTLNKFNTQVRWISPSGCTQVASIPVSFSIFSSCVLQSMQYRAVGLAFSRATDISLSHCSQRPYTPSSISCRERSIRLKYSLSRLQRWWENSRSEIWVARSRRSDRLPSVSSNPFRLQSDRFNKSISCRIKYFFR